MQSHPLHVPEMISVRQVKALLAASFSGCVTTDALQFANCSH